LKWNWFMVAMGTAAAALFILSLGRTLLSPAPRFEGQTVAYWAHELYRHPQAGPTNRATLAFQTLGVRAVPELRLLLYREDPAYKKFWQKLAPHLPRQLRTLPHSQIRLDALEYRMGAVRALGILGTNAAEALPDFLHLLPQTNSPLRWPVVQVMAQLGEVAITRLIPLTTNADPAMRHAAVYALGQANSNALPALLPLIRGTLDSDTTVRSAAWHALSRLGAGAVAPTVDLAVTHADPQLRAAAFRALAAMRPGPNLGTSVILLNPTNAAAIRRMAYTSLWLARQTNAPALQLWEAGLAEEDPQLRELVRFFFNRLALTNQTASP